MKKQILVLLTVLTITGTVIAQNVKSTGVPAAVKAALIKKYPDASKATWEKEKGHFEANWGGKSGEDMSVTFTPQGGFVEQVAAISPASLPASVKAYLSTNYKGAKIKEAGKVTDAKGVIMYEAEVNGKDLVFDENGKFIKLD
jgi:hypothetical protein